jgi:Cu+-exporting ATPase
VPTSILRPGDEIIIEPFRLVPCDSYILEGSTYVNEAIITGESYPKLKDVGSLMLAGSRNGSNQLKAAVHQDYSRSFLSQLIRSIEVSLTSKALAQKRVDVVTQYFVSVIFAIAALASAFTFARARSAGFGVALDAAGCRLMTILAAACPCALGLATPCAVMAGIDVAWRKGILMLEGGETMEIVQKTSHVVMDKTGTLTQGTPTVTNMILNGKWKNKERELAVLICAAEEKGLSSHPLAMAIFKKLLPMCEGLWSEYKSKGNTNNLQEFGGRGVLCDVNSGAGEWQHICVGNLKFLHENHVEGIEDILISSDQEGSAVFVGIDSELAAFLILQVCSYHSSVINTTVADFM